MKLRYLRDNVAIAALLGCFIGIGFMLLIGSNFSHNTIKFGTYGIAIVVSLLASGLALAGVFANIDNQNELATQQRQNALKASRAVLPIALNEVVAKCRRGIEIRLDQNIADSSPHQLLEQITITETSLKILQSNVEIASDENARALSSAISRYATLTVRYGNQNSEYTQKFESFDDVSGRKGQGAAINWAEVLLRFEGCYEYARGKTELISTAIDEFNIRSLFMKNMSYLDIDPRSLDVDLEKWRRSFDDSKNKQD
jgi:hypothetical protein